MGVITVDMQTAFNLATGLAGALGMWVLKYLASTIKQLERDLREQQMAFVRRDDYRADMVEVKTLLHRIEDKLDQKADRTQ